jgi:hypothetical protein
MLAYSVTTPKTPRLKLKGTDDGDCTAVLHVDVLRNLPPSLGGILM